MSIGTWRQSPPARPRRAPPGPPEGHPFLTGYTEMQGEQLKQNVDSLQSMVGSLTMPEGSGPSNGGTGPSAENKSWINRAVSGQKAKVK